MDLQSHQAPLSKEFSWQEYWGRLSFPTPGDLNPGIEPVSLASPASAGRLFTTGATWEAQHFCHLQTVPVSLGNQSIFPSTRFPWQPVIYFLSLYITLHFLQFYTNGITHNLCSFALGFLLNCSLSNLHESLPIWLW